MCGRGQEEESILGPPQDMPGSGDRLDQDNDAEGAMETNKQPVEEEKKRKGQRKKRNNGKNI